MTGRLNHRHSDARFETCWCCEGSGEVPTEKWRCWYCGAVNEGWRRVCRAPRGRCATTREENMRIEVEREEEAALRAARASAKQETLSRAGRREPDAWLWGIGDVYDDRDRMG